MSGIDLLSALYVACICIPLAAVTWMNLTKPRVRRDLLRRAGYARINGYLVRVERAP